MSQLTDETLGRSLLASLFFSPGAMSVTALVGELETVHSLLANTDRVRGLLNRMADWGLVRFAANTASLTPAGRDLARGLGRWPGE